MQFRTRAIHAGQGPDPLHGAVMTPVYQTSTFAFNAPDDSGEFDYSRSGNPTRKALEECLASLENGTRGFAFATGMAAETTLLMMLNAGDHLILSHECYGGTYRVAGLVGSEADADALSDDKIASPGLTISQGYVRTDCPNGGCAFPNLSFGSEAIRSTIALTGAPVNQVPDSSATFSLLGLALGGLGLLRRPAARRR